MALHCTTLVAHPSHLLPPSSSHIPSRTLPLPSLPLLLPELVHEQCWVSMALCRVPTLLSLSGAPWSCHVQAVLILCHISAHFVGKGRARQGQHPSKGPACHASHPAAELWHQGQNWHGEHVHNMLKDCHSCTAESVEITHSFPWAL